MTDIEFIQQIGNEICEGCGPDRDCGEKLEECSRIDNAIKLFRRATDHPRLGFSTTAELIDELRARCEVNGTIDYRTVD